MSDDESYAPVWRTLAGTIGLLLWFVALVLLGFPMQASFSNGEGETPDQATCEPVLAPILPFLADGDSGAASGGVRDTGQAGYDDVVAACGANRDATLGVAGLLALPGTVILSGLVGTRRRTPA